MPSVLILQARLSMGKKKDFYQIVEDICVKDPRYKPDAYEFVMQALHFTQKKIGRQGHLTGFELSQGIRDFAIEQYGAMTKAVLSHWGIHKTDDFGQIVFHMVEKKILSKTEEDDIDDFKNVYNFDSAFSVALKDHVRELK